VAYLELLRSTYAGSREAFPCRETAGCTAFLIVNDFIFFLHRLTGVIYRKTGKEGPRTFASKFLLITLLCVVLTLL
jgi:hypothetical protein